MVVKVRLVYLAAPGVVIGCSGQGKYLAEAKLTRKRVLRTHGSRALVPLKPCSDAAIL